MNARNGRPASQGQGEPGAYFVALLAAVVSSDDHELRIPWSALEEARSIVQHPDYSLQVADDKQQNELVVKLLNKQDSAAGGSS